MQEESEVVRLMICHLCSESIYTPISPQKYEHWDIAESEKREACELIELEFSVF